MYPCKMRIAAKQRCPLMVLAPPEIPLYNVLAEPGACAWVRQGEVHCKVYTREGTRPGDTFMTLVETTTTGEASFSHSIYDRVVGAFPMPSLDDLSAEQAEVLNLGSSWDTL